jgi:sarcosine oxidase subunit beta
MADVIIIGGGLIGTSIAAQLDPSHQVTLLEKCDLLGAGTTADSVAMFGWSYDQPLTLIEYSWNHYRKLIEEGELSFERIGTYRIRETREGVEALHETQERLSRFGFQSTIEEPTDLASTPVSPPEESIVLSIPAEDYLDTGEIVSKFTEHARDRNIEIKTGVEVTNILSQNGSVTAVVTDNMVVEADFVINAAGPWAVQVNEMAGVSVPLRHNRGPILVLDCDQPCSLPNTSFESGYYLRGEGQTLALAGKRGSEYSETTRYNPDTPRSISTSQYVQFEEVISSTVPMFADANIINEWVGLRTVTPDGRPVVGQYDLEGFVLACGLNGAGVTIGPAIGKLVSEVVEGKQVHLDSLAPDRFNYSC